MPNEIWVAIIAGGMAFLGTLVTTLTSASKTRAEIKTSQELMKKDISNLTVEVREHNNFARRMPVVEEQIKVINHRLDDLERK